MRGPAFSQLLGKKQIPWANPALGMTVVEFFGNFTPAQHAYRHGLHKPIRSYRAEFQIFRGSTSGTGTVYQYVQPSNTKNFIPYALSVFFRAGLKMKYENYPQRVPASDLHRNSTGNSVGCCSRQSVPDGAVWACDAIVLLPLRL